MHQGASFYLIQYQMNPKLNMTSVPMTHLRGIPLMTTGVLGSLIWNLIVSMAFSPSVTL